MKQPNLFDDAPEPAGPPAVPEGPDAAARRFAVDPAHDVVLEASAGTGKTRVLVDRYVRLIELGVDPRNILAITFTRKAAAEMRERVLAALRARAAAGAFTPDAWRALRDRIVDIQISTIDAFCFSLLREFPLEAGVEPGFDVADETEIGRFSREAADLAIRAARRLLTEDEALRLLFAHVRLPAFTSAVAGLLDRRHVALPAVASFVRRRAADATATAAAREFIDRIRRLLDGSPYRETLLDQGPGGSAEFRWLRADLVALDQFTMPADLPRLQQVRRRLERYFLTKAGEPRKKTAPAIKADLFPSKPAKQAHDAAVQALAPEVADAIAGLERAINAVLARGLLRLLSIAAARYEALLDDHALLDFAGMLDRAVRLLARQEEFARSRLKLQARHHHLLVDEFQDTSRLQWRLIELLIDAWGEGESAAGAPTSIFIVGDRKQSIYRFRHAEVTLLDEAARRIEALRPGRPVRAAITTSYRAVPELLAFVNALASSIESPEALPERFTYTELDRFPSPAVASGALRDGEPVLGLVAESSMAACASAVAAEVARLLGHALVRQREGPPRPARADDIAILFRARAGHQYFETALEALGIRTYVYKGLGFFDAPEVQDVQALVRFFARPDSNLRAAEFLRSRFVRLSDPALVALAPHFADALLGDLPARTRAALDEGDEALLDLARQHVGAWIARADYTPPGELVDLVLRESAYFFEARGRRLDQARENVKKVRALIRRVESRGYATLGRIAEYFETLRAGDEANAILEASGAVNLMTVHAAKGLEFPIVFVVNLQAQARGRGGGLSVIEHGPDGESDVAFTSTDATKLEDLRETEELRRLFYVAVTRARDRLYLAAQVGDRAQVPRGARSFAHLLPQSLLGAFTEAAGRPPEGRITWDTPDGAFTFRVCPAGTPGDPVAPPALIDDRDLDVGWLAPPRPAPVAATAAVEPAPAAARPSRPSGRSRQRAAAAPAGASPGPHERLTGTLVHRLFQRRVDPAAPLNAVAAEVPGLLTHEERVDVRDVAGLAASVAALYLRLRDNPELAAVLASGQVFYEVPFSMVEPGRPDVAVRGSIDCLVVPAGGAPVVLEFKTGEPRPEHEAQLAGYARAVREIFAKNTVKSRIFYA